MRGHCRALLIVQDGSRHFVRATWDDQDRLSCAVGGQTVSVPDTGGLAPTALVTALVAQGLEVECCNECEWFVYAGLGVDSGSTIGACAEGKPAARAVRFGRQDDTNMTDWCEAFSRGEQTVRPQRNGSVSADGHRPKTKHDPTP